jgi:signal peptidase I
MPWRAARTPAADVTGTAAGRKIEGFAMAQVPPRRGRGCLRWILILAIVGVTAYLLWRTFVVRQFRVPAAVTDMSPTLRPGDRAGLDKLTYYITPPHRGDIVAIRAPGAELGFDIRRIVALPGETVDIKGGVLTVNGARTADSYAHGKLRGDFGPQRLSEDKYFVLPDDREAYSSSTANPVVARDDVVGRVVPAGR